MILTKENKGPASGWSAHELAGEIYKWIDKENTLIVSLTWFNYDSDCIEIEKWLDQHPCGKIILISMFDPPNHDDVNSLKLRYKDKITVIGNNDICFWLIAVDRFFLNYTIEDVTPTKFEYNFLCYQRKPNKFRTYIYDSLKNKKGIVTIGDKKFQEINAGIPQHRGLTEVIGELEVPNDIWSLGDIDVWNSSFLTIVSETEYGTDNNYVFVSEKVFKPIIGLRPFICFGYKNTSKFLNNLGFETFDQEFNYVPSELWYDTADSIRDIADQIDSSIFDKLMPKLIHNKNHLKIAAQKEWDKIVQLAK